MRCLALILLSLSVNAFGLGVEYACRDAICPPVDGCDAQFYGVRLECDLQTGNFPLDQQCGDSVDGQTFRQTLDVLGGQSCTAQYYRQCTNGDVEYYSDFSDPVYVNPVIPDAPESLSVSVNNGGSMAGNVIVDITQAVAPTAGGTTTQDIVMDLGGKTPKAAIFEVVKSSVNGTQADNAIISFGVTDGARSRSVGARIEDGLTGDSNVYRNSSATNLISILHSSANGFDGQATFDQWLSTTDTGNSTSGIRIDWGQYPPNNYLLKVTFFAGDDLQAYAGTVGLDDEDVVVDVTAPGFTPTVVFAYSHGTTIGSDGNFGTFSYGVATSSGQRSVTYKSRNNAGGDDSGAFFSTNYVAGQLSISNGDTLDWGAEIGTFDASGFSATSRLDDSNGDDLIYLAVDLDDRAVAIGSVDSPTSTGNTDIMSGLGFTPQFGMIGTTTLTAENAGSEAVGIGSVGVGSFSANNEYSISFTSEATANPTNAHSLNNNIAINMSEDDGTGGYSATFNSFGSGSASLNFSSVAGVVHKWFYFAIEEPTAGGSTTPVSSDKELRFDVLNSVSSDADLLWDLLNSVTSDVNTEWSILNSLFTDSELRWNAYNAVVNDSQTNWDVLNSVESDGSVLWSLLNAVQSDRQLLFSLLEAVTANADLRYNLLNSVESDEQLLWDVVTSLIAQNALSLHFGVLNSSQQSLNTRWNILNAVIQENTAAWGVLNSAQSDSQAVWNISGSSENSLSAMWSVLGSVANTTSVVYSVTSFTEQTMTVQYRIAADSDFPDIIIGAITFDANQLTVSVSTGPGIDVVAGDGQITTT